MTTTINNVKTLQIRNAKNGDFDLNLEGCDCAYLESLIYNAYPTESESGNPIYFDDGADNIPVKELIVNLEPKQSGSGDPSPSNVRPITGYDGVTVKRTGKNLANVFDDGFVPSTSTGQLVEYTGARTDYIRINPNSAYCATVNPSTEQFFLFFYDKDKQFISYNAGTQSILATSPTNARYAMLRVSENQLANSEIQLELGTTATEYEPYTEQEYSITLPSSVGTVYGGSLNVTTGVLTVDRVCKTLKTARNLSGAYPGSIIYNQESPETNDADFTKPIICNRLKYVGNWITEFEFGTCINYNNVSFNLWLKDSAFSSLSEATAWLNENETQLCYYLATPTTIQLTPTEVSTLLGSNTISSDGSMELEYRADISKVIEKLTNAIISLGGNV